MNKVDSVKLICRVQIEQLEERQVRLQEEIIDCELQIEYLTLLLEDISSINVLNYLPLDKKFYNLERENEESKTKET
tara:strand:+ start:68 stop:298 length:231 start_codon:yes stop_codon:yes gene_type:complete